MYTKSLWLRYECFNLNPKLFFKKKPKNKGRRLVQQIAKNFNKRAARFCPQPSIFQRLFINDLFLFVETVTLPSSDKSANIVFNRLRHDFFNNIEIVL